MLAGQSQLGSIKKTELLKEVNRSVSPPFEGGVGRLSQISIGIGIGYEQKRKSISSHERRH
jgi:hypothetical protein